MPAPGRVFTPDPVAPHDLNESLVAWWLGLDGLDGGRTLYDLVGSVHGTLTNGPTWVGYDTGGSDPFGALQLTSGSSQFVDFGTSNPGIGSGPFTVSAWARPDGTTNYPTIVERAGATGTYSDRHLELDLGADGLSPRFFVFSGLSGYEASGGTVTVGQWTHFAGVYDGSTVQLYLNGKLVTSAAGPGSLNNTGNLVLGRGGASDAQYFGGQIADVRLYSRALSASDIYGIYDRSLLGHPDTLRRVASRPSSSVVDGTGRLPSFGRVYTPDPVSPHELNEGLVAWWSGIDGLDGGRTLYDLVNNNHVTLTNGPVWVGSESNENAAISFDGSNDYAASGSLNLTAYNKIYITFYANISWTTNFTMFFEHGTDVGSNAGFGCYYSTQGGTSLYCSAQGSGGGWDQSGFPVPSNGWHHYVFAFDLTAAAGSQELFWLDGVPQTKTSNPITNSNAGRVFPNSVLYLMNRAGNTQFLAGTIADVRLVAGRVPTNSEAYGLYEQSIRGNPDTLRRTASRSFMAAALPDVVNGAPGGLSNRGRIYVPDPVAPHDLNEGLTAWWLAIDGLGGGRSLYDLVGNNHGVLTNGPLWTGYESGGTDSFEILNFDGSDDYVTAGAVGPDGASSFAISAWVRPTVNGTRKGIVSRDGTSRGWYLFLNDTPINGLQFNVRRGGTDILLPWGSTVSSGVWYFVCAGYDAAASLIWISVNGGSRVTGSTGGAIDTTTDSLRIGSRELGAAPDYWQGQIGDVRTYDGRTLSDVDVYSLYEQSLRGHPDTLRRIDLPTSTTAAGVVTYTGTASLTAQSASLSSSATFVAPTYTGTAALGATAASLAASGTVTQPTYTGTGALTASASTLSSSAAFTAPVYTGTGTLTAAASSLSASATFTPPSYTGTAALTSSTSVLSSSATFTAPVYTGTGALTATAASLSSSATFTAPVYTATGSLTATAAALSAAATFTPPSYTATAALSSSAASLAASGIFASQVYSGSGVLTSSAAALTASATFTPVYMGTGTLIAVAASLSASVTFVPPTYAASASLTSSPASLAATASFTTPIYVGTVVLTASTATLSASATASSTYTGAATLNATPSSLVATAIYVAEVSKFPGQSVSVIGCGIF